MGKKKDDNVEAGNHFTSQDREIMIRNSINTENVVKAMEKFDEAIKSLQTTIDGRFQDFDLRVRDIEKKIESFTLAKSLIYGLCGLILVSVIGVIINGALVK